MNNPEAARWAKENIPTPLEIKLPMISQGLQKGAWIAIGLFFGLMVWAMIASFVKNVRAYNSYEWRYLGIAAFLIIGIVGFYIFITGRKRELIVSIDANGLQTKAGKKLPWENLEKVHIHLASQNTTRGINYDFVRFHFSNGKANASSFSPSINTMMWVAENIPAKKT